MRPVFHGAVHSQHQNPVCAVGQGVFHRQTTGVVLIRLCDAAVKLLCLVFPFRFVAVADPLRSNRQILVVYPPTQVSGEHYGAMGGNFPCAIDRDTRQKAGFINILLRE